MIGCDVPVRSKSALIRACKAGQLQKAADLLHKGGNCNIDEFGLEGLNSLHVASRMDHTAVCYICCLGVSRHTTCLPLFFCFEFHCTQVCSPNNIFYYFSLHCSIQIVKLLLKKKANPNIQARGNLTAGWTPLHFAYDNGHTHLVPMLAERGADSTILDLNGEPPVARLEMFKKLKAQKEKKRVARLKARVIANLKHNETKHATTMLTRDLLAEEDAKLNKIFKHVDRNRDGIVSRKEVMRLLRKVFSIDKKQTKSKTKIIMSRLDTDKNGELSLLELKSAFRRLDAAVAGKSQ